MSLPGAALLSRAIRRSTAVGADRVSAALDVSVQAPVLELLLGLHEKRRVSLVLVTHDLLVAATTADVITMMKEGSGL